MLLLTHSPALLRRKALWCQHVLQLKRPPMANSTSPKPVTLQVTPNTCHSWCLGHAHSVRP